MEYRIEYHRRIDQKALTKLSVQDRNRIEGDIFTKLAVAPDVFGKSLRRSLRGHRVLRVGDYRVIYRVAQQTVLVLDIFHRSRGYEGA